MSVLNTNLPQAPVRYDAENEAQHRRAVSTALQLLAAARVVVATPYTPTGSADGAGTVGQVAYDASYIYVKTAAGAWKRAALSTF